MSTEKSSFVELSVAEPSKTRKYTAAERHMHYTEWCKSGLSMNEYCRRSGLLISTFSLWVKKIKSELITEPKKEFEKLPDNGNPGGLEIILVSGIRLRLTRITNMAEVLRLVKALESCG